MDPNISRYLYHHGGKYLTPIEHYILGKLLYNTQMTFIVKTFAFFNYFKEHVHELKNKTSNKHEALSLIEVIIATRILKKHPEVINNCPKCKRLARTPKAKQCRYCFHSWY